MATVSVVIPTYNYARYIGAAVESALSQTAPAAEIIVVDDGSTDGTPEVLRQYGHQIRVVRKENAGLAAARNSGAAVARGELLAFLDSDDMWLPRKLELQVERFVSDPGLGLVHCGVQDIDGAGTAIEDHLDGLEGWVAAELLLLRRAVILGGGSSAIVTRKAFEAVGGFDTRLRHSEDWDLHYRVACRYRVGFVPTVLVQYRRHGGNMSRNVRELERALLFLFQNIFCGTDPELGRLRRRCYGNLHAMLAGSFFAAALYGPFLEHACRSVVLAPENLLWFLAYPLRRLWRRRQRSAKSVSGVDRQALAGIHWSGWRNSNLR